MEHGIEYQNFDVVIEKSGDKYRARVINSPCGQAAVAFEDPFSQLELEVFVLRMGRPRSGMRRIDSPEMQAARDLGERLFTTVFRGEVNSCYLRSVDNVLSKNKGLRVRLHINAPEFNDYPWEYLYNPQFGQFVALSHKTPIIRYIELPYTTRALPVQVPLIILVMISSPEGYPKLDVEQEWKTLNRALKPLLDRGQVVLEKLEQPTLRALRKKLRQDRVHIFHYIGHGKYFEDKQDGMLLLEDGHGRGRPTSGQHLGAILHNHYPLRLVVLNACEGARTSAEDPYAGVAQTLVRQGIPAVLAMQFEIFEDAAMTFAEEFYSAIVDNYPVDAALSEARLAIFSSPNDVEWGTPVLFMRTPDGMLFRPESAEERAARLKAAREREERKKKEAEERERVAREEKLRKEKEVAEKAAKERAERKAAEKAALDKAKKEAKEKAERKAAEKAAIEKAKREAAEKTAREKEERERIEREEKVRKEKEAGELHYKGMLAQKDGRYNEAEGLFRQSLAIAIELGDEQGQTNINQQLVILDQERLAKEKIEREAAEKAAKEKAEREAVEKAAKEKAEREAAEKTAKEKNKRDQDIKQKATQISTPVQPPKPKSRIWMVYCVTGFIAVALCIAVGVWIVSLINSPAVPEEPAATEAPAAEESEATEAPAPEEQMEEPTEEPMEEPANYFFDDFSDNSNGWNTGEKDNEWFIGSRSIANGVFVWDVTEVKIGFVTHTSIPNIDPVENFYLSVYGDSGNSSYYRYGVYFRYDEGAYYLFQISENMEYRFRYYDGSNWETMIDWTDSSVIKTGDWNRIEVIANGNQFEFLINGKGVMDYIDSRLSKGKLGLAIGASSGAGPGQIWFDNVEFEVR